MSHGRRGLGTLRLPLLLLSSKNHWAQAAKNRDFQRLEPRPTYSCDNLSKNPSRSEITFSTKVAYCFAGPTCRYDYPSICFYCLPDDHPIADSDWWEYSFAMDARYTGPCNQSKSSGIMVKPCDCLACSLIKWVTCVFDNLLLVSEFCRNALSRSIAGRRSSVGRASDL